MNKTFFIAGIAAVLITFASCAGSPSASGGKGEEFQQFHTYNSMPKDTEQWKYYKTGEGFLAFNLYKTTQYQLLGEDYPNFYCSIFYKKFGDLMDEEYTYSTRKIKIDGTMVPVTMENLEPVTKDGKTSRTLKVTVGETVYSFDGLKIETIPVSKGMSYDEVIAILGEPNDEDKGALDTYSGSNSLAVDFDDRYKEYWYLKYDKYPGCTFGFSQDRKLINF